MDLKNGQKAKIGFAWNEENTTHEGFNSWKSKAYLTKNKKWLIFGNKCAILKDYYDYYAIFCSTTDYKTKVDFTWLIDKESPPNGIIGFLVPASLIRIEEEIGNGIECQKISFDSIELDQNSVLIDASQFGCSSLNVYGVGLLAVSSYFLGQIKSLLKYTYLHLIKDCRNSLKLSSIEKICCDVTNQIYSLESCIYLTSSMYDLFDHVNSDPDIYLEASICLILALESTRKIVKSLQSIWQSKAWITSPFFDLLNTFEYFMADSLFLKIFLANVSMDFVLNQCKFNLKNFKMTPYYNADFVKDYLKQKKKEKNNIIFDSLGLESNVPSQLGHLAYILSHFIQKVDFISKSKAFASANKKKPTAYAIGQSQILFQ